jgi:isopentenyldiphosphate isomerase
MPKDDPTELFDLCTPSGRPLGRSKPRGLVHRDGDWHRSLHLWVVLAGPPPALLLQRRSLTKDTHPGKVDVSVAGHLRAGEGPFDALREAEEEIGLVVTASDVVRLGVRRRVDVHPPELVDREVQEVFLVETARAIESFRPDPDEVLGLLAVLLPDLSRLIAEERPSVRTRELVSRQRVAHSGTLTRSELVPSPDGYFAVAIAAIARRLAGADGVPFLLGGTESGELVE